MPGSTFADDYKLTFEWDEKGQLSRMDLPWGQSIVYETLADGRRSKRFEKFRNKLKGPYYSSNPDDFTNQNNYRYGVHNELIRRLELLPDLKFLLDFYFDPGPSRSWFDQVRPYTVPKVEDGDYPKPARTILDNEPQLKSVLAAWATAVLTKSGEFNTLTINDPLLLRIYYFMTLYSVWTHVTATNSSCEVLESAMADLDQGVDEGTIQLKAMFSIRALAADCSERFVEATGYDGLEDVVVSIAKKKTFDAGPLLAEIVEELDTKKTFRGWKRKII